MWPGAETISSSAKLTDLKGEITSEGRTSGVSKAVPSLTGGGN
jgi:hypothetical protein